MFDKKQINTKIVEAYKKYLYRSPDNKGLYFYLENIMNGNISVDDLPKIFQSSDEHKMSFPTVFNRGIFLNWMDTNSDCEESFAEHDKTHSSKDFSDLFLEKNLMLKYVLENKEPSKMRVLEIGCGNGQYMRSLSKIFGEIIGIDTSIENVVRTNQSLLHNKNCIALHNNGYDLSIFNDNKFDFCYSINTFQNLPRELFNNYVSEISRVLRSESIFRFNLNISAKSNSKNTSIIFSKNEISKIAYQCNFEYVSINDHDNWHTFRPMK